MSPRQQPTRCARQSPKTAASAGARPAAPPARSKKRKGRLPLPLHTVFCICAARSVPVVLAVAAGIRALGMALRTLVRMVGMALRFFCQMIGLPLRALRRVLRVALGLLGRVLRLAGQLRRLPLLARHLLLRLTAQARLELLLMAQLLLGGVLLVPLLMRGHVLFVPLGQLRLMLGAASAAFGALVLDARVQLRPAGLDARRARGMICAEIVVEVVAPLAHVLDELGVLLLDAVDEAVALDLDHILKAYDGEEALEILKENEVHLLIMDVMMPRLDGIRATLKIREESSIPIIILSAKTEDADKILGLNIGADDYVEKPFNPLELVARVKSQLRRYTQLGNAAESSASVYTVGGLSINDDLKEVTVDGEVVKLTPIEYNILLLLVKNQGKVFSINQIYESIWNEDAIGADNTVAVHIRHIREKIEINPKEPRYLKVVWGVGYKIDKN